ncbi:MAG TPA: peptidoglycan-binding protein [Chthoniobacterales bacterium]|nr:peptidoglycan-binding protein [Chthoniobacterales bacterium]
MQVNRNRHNDRHVNRNSFTVARSRVIRTPHNRNWWHNHFNTTFVLFGGGYYYWWDGWWYPAYGYSPYYNSYLYSEPIYAPNSIAPGQVIENVQIALRDEGYYPGAIDGIVGFQTRAALAAFQRDHGLIVTEAIDEPTLVSLGLA